MTEYILISDGIVNDDEVRDVIFIYDRNGFRLAPFEFIEPEKVKFKDNIEISLVNRKAWIFIDDKEIELDFNDIENTLENAKRILQIT